MSELSAEQSTTRAKKVSRSSIVIWVGVGLLFIAAANIHLVFVAFTSQPSCVPHLKSNTTESSGYRAAKSVC